MLVCTNTCIAYVYSWPCVCHHQIPVQKWGNHRPLKGYCTDPRGEIVQCQVWCLAPATVMLVTGQYKGRHGNSVIICEIGYLFCLVRAAGTPDIAAMFGIK